MYIYHSVVKNLDKADKQNFKPIETNDEFEIIKNIIEKIIIMKPEIVEINIYIAVIYLYYILSILDYNTEPSDYNCDIKSFTKLLKCKEKCKLYFKKNNIIIDVSDINTDKIDYKIITDLFYELSFSSNEYSSYVRRKIYNL